MLAQVVRQPNKVLQACTLASIETYGVSFGRDAPALREMSDIRPIWFRTESRSDLVT